MAKNDLNETGHDCPHLVDGEACGGAVMARDYPFREGQRQPAHCATCGTPYVLLRSRGDLILEPT
jgi:hypothetical protein